MRNGDIKRFLNTWKESSAARLLWPDPENSILELDKEGGLLASVAFLAWDRGLLYKLDYIVEKWQIPSKGTNEFKGKLKENWLSRVENRRRNVGNDTLSALTELMVASYLDNVGFDVTDLSAWGNEEADVICVEKNNKAYFEVKYFSDSPELYAQRLSAAKANGVTVGSIPNRPTMLNYFYYRLAEAVIQLDKVGLPAKYNNVFFVFSELADRPGRREFEKSVGRFQSWYEDNSGNYPGVLEKNKQAILSENPANWIARIGGLFIGTISNWSLVNITRHLQPPANRSG
ncbi:MAG: hypothetical protein ACNYWU_09125 [Desulfobacterales bacterium]